MEDDVEQEKFKETKNFAVTVPRLGILQCYGFDQERHSSAVDLAKPVSDKRSVCSYAMKAEHPMYHIDYIWFSP